MPRGQGVRCAGFLSDDGQYAHCTRDEHAGGLEVHPGSNTYAHWLQGKCRCGETHSTQVSESKARANGHAPLGKVVKVYDYVDEEGKLLFQEVRYEPKNFRQRRSDGDGGWIWNLEGVRRVPYRLRELLESTKEPVFIPEGPKDADRLWEEGLTATTNPMGAGKWSPEYNGFLQGRHVVVLPDMDPPNPAKPAEHLKGQRHGQAVANSLYGTAASVRYLELPGLPEHGDVSDWFDQGHTADELLELARKCPEWNPEIVSDLYRDGLPSETKILMVRTAREIAETTPESPDWLIEGYLAKGSITFLTGKAKVAGKTTFALSGMKSMFDGLPFLGFQTRKTRVVLLTEERPSTLRQALERTGLAESEDLLVVSWHEASRQFEWAEAVEAATALAQQQGVGLLVVDTLAQWAGLKGNTENDSGAMLEAMKPLQAAAASGLAVLVNHHDRKSGGEVGDSGRGSGASTGAADIILNLQRSTGGEHAMNRRELHALSRFDQTPAKLVIELKDGRYVCLGDSASVAVADARNYLIEHLPRSEEAAKTESEIVDASDGQARTTIRTAIAGLHSEGSVSRVGSGKRGNPYRYFICDADTEQTKVPSEMKLGSEIVSDGSLIPIRRQKYFGDTQDSLEL